MMTESTYTRRKPTVLRMIVKLVLALFLGLFLWAGVLVMFDNAEYASWSADEAKTVNSCDRYYYNGDYAGLYDELNLYGLYSDTYDIYWEVVDGCNDFLKWQQWEKLARTGDETAAAKALYYKEKVEANARNCAFEKNQKTLNAWKEETEKEISL